MRGMERWLRFHEEVERFCGTLERVPEQCECGDAAAHLEGACRCCHGHLQDPSPAGEPRCAERIALLRADLTLLCEDFREAAQVHAAPGDGVGLELRRALLLFAGELSAMLSAIDHLDRAVVGFQHTCSLSELKQVKRHAQALRQRCAKVDDQLAGMPVFGPTGARDVGSETKEV